MTTHVSTEQIVAGITRAREEARVSCDEATSVAEELAGLDGDLQKSRDPAQRARLANALRAARSSMSECASSSATRELQQARLWNAHSEPTRPRETSSRSVRSRSTTRRCHRRPRRHRSDVLREQRLVTARPFFFPCCLQRPPGCRGVRDCPAVGLVSLPVAGWRSAPSARRQGRPPGFSRSQQRMCRCLHRRRTTLC